MAGCPGERLGRWSGPLDGEVRHGLPGRCTPVGAQRLGAGGRSWAETTCGRGRAPDLTQGRLCGELVPGSEELQRMVARSGGGKDGQGKDGDGGMVSLMAEVPEPLLRAMRSFIDCHPNWDQYRLFQAALAGFLVQHAPGDRAITRCYLANLFPGSGRFQAPPMAGRSVVPGPLRDGRGDERPRLRPLPAGASHAPDASGRAA